MDVIWATLVYRSTHNPQSMFWSQKKNKKNIRILHLCKNCYILNRCVNLMQWLLSMEKSASTVMFKYCVFNTIKMSLQIFLSFHTSLRVISKPHDLWPMDAPQYGFDWPGSFSDVWEGFRTDRHIQTGWTSPLIFSALTVDCLVLVASS